MGNRKALRSVWIVTHTGISVIHPAKPAIHSIRTKYLIIGIFNLYLSKNNILNPHEKIPI
jgi:hypothetical protein